MSAMRFSTRRCVGLQRRRPSAEVNREMEERLEATWSVTWGARGKLDDGVRGHLIMPFSSKLNKQVPFRSASSRTAACIPTSQKEHMHSAHITIISKVARSTQPRTKQQLPSLSNDRGSFKATITVNVKQKGFFQRPGVQTNPGSFKPRKLCERFSMHIPQRIKLA